MSPCDGVTHVGANNHTLGALSLIAFSYRVVVPLGHGEASIRCPYLAKKYPMTLEKYFYVFRDTVFKPVQYLQVLMRDGRYRFYLF